MQYFPAITHGPDETALNLGYQDLGYLFGMHYSIVLRYFNKWIHVLHDRLSAVSVRWPERDQLLKTVPMEF